MNDTAVQSPDLGIVDVAYALPERVVSSEEIAARHGFDTAFIRDKLGISRRHIVSDSETTSSLAAAAGRAVLRQSRLAAEAIDLLIVVTQTPDHLVPHTSALVHDAMKLRRDCAVFDISLGCSGWVYGLSTALGLMQTQGMQRALLVTADTYSRLIDPGDRATAPLFGDGAAATLLGPQPRYRVGRTTFGSDGASHGALIARGSGAAPGEGSALHMDGRAIFNFMMTEIPANIDRCLAQNGIRREDIDLWVFHQASRFLLETLGKHLSLPRERIVVDLDDIGNTTSSTIPIALARAVLAGNASPQRIFVSGFGVGLSWSSSVLFRN